MGVPRSQMCDWTDDQQARLLLLRMGHGWSYGKIAQAMGISRSAVAGRIRGYLPMLLGTVKTQKRLPYPSTIHGGGRGKARTYTEESLTETWAERKARRLTEREAAGR